MNKILSLFSDIQSFIVSVIAYILMYLEPISNFIILVMILIAIDLVTGSYAAKKEGEKFSAKKMRNTIEKFIFYGLAIIVAFILQRIADDGSDLAKIIALYIGATETKSIFENICRITKTDIMLLLWDAVKSKLENLISGSKSNKESR